VTKALNSAAFPRCSTRRGCDRPLRRQVAPGPDSRPRPPAPGPGPQPRSPRGMPGSRRGMPGISRWPWTEFGLGLDRVFRRPRGIRSRRRPSFRPAKPPGRGR